MTKRREDNGQLQDGPMTSRLKLGQRGPGMSTTKGNAYGIPMGNKQLLTIRRLACLLDFHKDINYKFLCVKIDKNINREIYYPITSK